MNWLRHIRRVLERPASDRPSRADANRARLGLEQFESRLVPYAATGSAWPAPQMVTISFVPDGTVVGTSGKTNVTSNLFATWNAKFGSAAAWQNIVLKAAQTWAQQANINFSVVPDDGAAIGSGAYQQGDPKHGDIRIGGYNFGSSVLANAYSPPPANNYDIAGDIRFNTGQSFNSGTTYDLFTVSTHEIGHALGLGHSSVVSAQLYASYGGVKNALTSDDIAGVQAVYGGPRRADAYDANGANNSFSTADDVTSTVSPTNYTAVLSGLDIGSTSDVDYYKLSGLAPTTTGKVTVTVQSQGLSLLAPSLKVYAGDMTTLVGSATGTSGSTASVTFSGLGSGKTFYLVVDGADATAFGTGAYALTLNTGSGADPAVPLPNTTTANGAVRNSGGGIATKIQSETLANITTTGSQQFAFTGQREVAMDANGNFAVVWSAANQDGNSQGVFARLFNADGTARTGEFQVNTYYAGVQTDPTVAMAPDGTFVVTWSSSGQDAASSWGVYGQRFSATGAKVGGEFRVNVATAGDQTQSSVATDALGNFTVTWTAGDGTGTGTGVFARRFSALGVPLSGEFRVNTTTAGDQRYAQVGMNADGATVVTWTSSSGDGSGSGVYAQLYTAAGVPLGGEFRVNTFTAGNQMYSSAAMSAAGDFVVTWSSDGQDGSGFGVYAQRFSALGAKVGGEFRANTHSANGQKYSQVAMDAVGNFTIVWASDLQDGGGWGAYGQQYAASGTPLGGEFLVNTTTAQNQQYPTVVMDSLGHMVVAWYGNGGPDAANILFQRFDATTQDQTAGAVSHDFDPEGHEHDGDEHTGEHTDDAPLPTAGAPRWRAAGHLDRAGVADVIAGARPLPAATGARALPASLRLFTAPENLRAADRTETPATGTNGRAAVRSVAEPEVGDYTTAESDSIEWLGGVRLSEPERFGTAPDEIVLDWRT